jgi:hypothetical protein
MLILQGVRQQAERNDGVDLLPPPKRSGGVAAEFKSEEVADLPGVISTGAELDSALSPVPPSGGAPAVDGRPHP